MTTTPTFPATFDFGYYNSFFHDGSVNAIVHIGDAVNILMNSAELLPEENRDGIALDQQRRLNGTLQVRGILSIVVNRQPYRGRLHAKSIDGELLDLEFASGAVELGIGWDYYPFPSNPRMADFSYIIIKADQILWEDETNNVTVDLSNLNTKPPSRQP